VNQEVKGQLEPSFVGWHGVADSVVTRTLASEDTFGRPFDLSRAEPAGDATRFEWGTWSVISVVGAKSALEFALSYPPADREPLIASVTDHLVDGLRKRSKRITSPLDRERRSGIIIFEVDNAAKIARSLLEQGVVVAPRVNTLRISPHFFNTNTEIDALLEKIQGRMREFSIVNHECLTFVINVSGTPGRCL
jgi:selenocysteine lyase/cysteine desulfurase